jgi:hypothetical protein
MPGMSQAAKESQAPGFGINVAAIGTVASDVSALDDSLSGDARLLSDFRRELKGRASVETFEVRLPPEADIQAVMDALRTFVGALDEGESAPFPFIEVPLGEGIEGRLAALAESEWLGAKARTGGPEPASYPDASSLAVFLQQCLDLGVPFKLTAGLHHPLPNVDSITGGHAHGFLNVFAACALHEAQALSRAEIRSALEEPSANAFVFDEQGLEWRGVRADLESIDSMRAVFEGYGSCSVTEPLEGLEALGLAKRVSA